VTSYIWLLQNPRQKRQLVEGSLLVSYRVYFIVKYGEMKDKMKDKKNLYVLVEFPYPSGSGLHMGHTFSYVGADVYVRFKRMQGFNVLFPIGWDAFGLPTENYAIKMKKKPQEVTAENISMFKNQMKKLKLSFNWDREISTADPRYYRWTQWIFIKLFEQGLAYKKEVPINWCPACKIGLANEEVVAGKCERCGTEVVKRRVSQWIVKITNYADKLIEGLQETDFEDKIKKAQINWIGKSTGALIKFPISNSEFQIEVFTTRPDTLPSATFLVLAPEHSFVSDLILQCSRPSDDCALKIKSETIENIRKYVEQAGKKSDFERGELNKEKTGVFTGLYATNPFNGQLMPIWISDFVLDSYGTGAIMSVPSQDQRDREFARKFNLPIISKPNLDMKEALKYGQVFTSYHLRDWIFSRQHYWGEPIPMIYCDHCGWQTVPEKQLPVVLPEVGFYEPTDTGESPLSKITDWIDTTCPKCGNKARRETDTMPNWAGSDWYFLRYLDPFNEKEFCSLDKAREWLPVDIYIGGDEHNTLHLLYSRFIYKFLFDLGLVTCPEPYLKRLSHGVILGPDNQRMSKSRGNVVVPDQMVDQYGADVVRMYLMFMGPFNSTMIWNEKALMGVKRFWDKFQRYLNEVKMTTQNCSEVEAVVNKLIEEVTNDLEKFKFNTAIAKIMKAFKKITNYQLPITKREKEILLAVIAPFVGDDSQVVWPKADKKYLVTKTVYLPIAVNGKVRDKIKIDQKTNKNIVLLQAQKIVNKWVGDKKIVRKIYVPGKMINFVLR